MEKSITTTLGTQKGLSEAMQGSKTGNVFQRSRTDNGIIEQGLQSPVESYAPKPNVHVSRQASNRSLLSFGTPS